MQLIIGHTTHDSSLIWIRNKPRRIDLLRRLFPARLRVVLTEVIPTHPSRVETHERETHKKVEVVQPKRVHGWQADHPPSMYEFVSSPITNEQPDVYSAKQSLACSSCTTDKRDS